MIDVANFLVIAASGSTGSGAEIALTIDRCEMVESRWHRPQHSNSAHRASFLAPRATIASAYADDRKRTPKPAPSRNDPPRELACRRHRREGSATEGKAAARG